MYSFIWGFTCAIAIWSLWNLYKEYRKPKSHTRLYVDPATRKERSRRRIAAALDDQIAEATDDDFDADHGETRKR